MSTRANSSDRGSTPPANLDAKNQMKDIVNKAMLTPIEENQANFKPVLISQEQILRIIEALSVLHGISNDAGFRAVALLFLKGAANKSAPNGMSVIVKGIDGQETIIKKSDLMMCYNSVTGNNYIRRLAESLACEICMFAEKNNIPGDLAIAANNYYVAQGELPLTKQEMSWSNSFVQYEQNVITDIPRVAQFLAQDFRNRFTKTKKPKKPKNKKEIKENTGNTNKKTTQE
jgi:hypothetical protein